jgi:hypothetical protein
VMVTVSGPSRAGGARRCGPSRETQGGDMGIVFFTDLYGKVTATAEGTDHNGALDVHDGFTRCI